MWSIDQGGSIETIDTRPRMTTLPTSALRIHYSVANMPGAVPEPRRSRWSPPRCRNLVSLANKGVSRALREERGAAERPQYGKGLHDMQKRADSLKLAYR
jgi:alanine dehydrogenase